MAGRCYQATRPGPANPPPAEARAAPTGLLLEPVVPTIEQSGCHQTRRVAVADCSARPSPEQLPEPVPVPRHPALKKASRSDPMMARRQPGRASRFAAAAGTLPAFPRRAGTAAAARAFPTLPVVAVRV